MLASFQIIAPVYYRWDYDAPLKDLYAEWRAAKQALEPEFKTENIRFERDPMWRHRLLSIQSAHDGNHWVWKVARVAWLGMGVSI